MTREEKIDKMINEGIITISNDPLVPEFGREAKFGAGTDSISLVNNSIYLGSLSRSSANNQTNEIVLGYNAIGEGSNTARIGNSSVTELHVGGNGASLALKSPNGTTWRISVDNAGTLVII